MFDADKFALIKAENHKLADIEYRSGKVALKSKPVAIFVELTQGCNLSCPMCRDQVISVRSRTMSDATFDKVSEVLFPTAELVDLRGWGESLILKDIIRRIELTSRFNVTVRVVTNLSFLRNDVLGCLIANDAIVDVSLDTSNKENLAEVRRGTNLNLVSRNLASLTADAQMRDRLTVLVTVQDKVVNDIPALMDFLAAHAVRNVRFFSVTSEQSSAVQLDQSNKRIDEVLENASSLAKKVGIKATAGTRLGNMPQNSSDHPICTHPWKYCNVAYDGSIGFCDHLIGPGNIQYFVGSINQTEFHDIWNSTSMIELRKEHLNLRRASAPKFSHCAWCYKNKYIDFEERFDPELASLVKSI